VSEPLSVDFSRHARQRMAERGITEKEVRWVLAAPDLILPSGQPGKKTLRARLGNGRQISVIIVDGSEPLKVVTVWEPS